MELHDGAATMDWNDVGITVPGSKSTQKFTHVTMGVMEAEKHSMVIKLLGETPDNKPVLKPVTVERKPKCVTCGKLNKASAKFCTECGTALEIFA
jgi:tRNA(Ile2) C34 agmatinyltransferase TiaS